MSIKNNVNQLLEEIGNIKRHNNINREVNVCAATKYVGPSEIKELYTAGIRDVGENRVDALLEKVEQLQHLHLTWHFIGTLQTRKVKQIINHIDYIHSLDRESLAKEIQKQSQKIISCFVQVNCSQEQSKHGLGPEEVINFVKSLQKYDKIKVVGLMTMAANTEDQSRIRQAFAQLKAIQDEIIHLGLDYAPCNMLSMGMSNDYELAILEGATIIRVGSKLFK